MFKVLIFFFLSISSITKSIGQQNKLILTETQNNIWLNSLSKSSFQNQLNMINDRLLDDTAVYVKKSYSDVIRGNYQQGNKIEGHGKPILIINGNYFIFENYTEVVEIIKLTKLLNAKNINSITILKVTDAQSTAVFGTIGENGAILLTTSNKKKNKSFIKLKI